MTTDELNILITAQTSDAEQNIQKTNKDLNELGKTAQSSNGGMSQLAAGFKNLKGIIGALGIGKFLKDSNDAYNVQMQNELKLTAHMKARMNATDDQIQTIKDLTSAQQKLGVIGDEIQLAGAQQLTTYAKQSSTLETLIPAMNDLIAQNAGYEASVGDAESAANMLGKALNGQYTGIERMIGKFTEAQENVLKFGTEEEKAAVLAEAIRSKFGNINEILANTPTGRLKQLQNDFGDLQEQLGATFQPLISSLVPIAADVMGALAPVITTLSTGISTIGRTLAKLDSPATRAIAFTVAGIAAVNRLKKSLGGVTVILSIIGSLLAYMIGDMNKEEDAVGDVVSTAFSGTTKAFENATDAAKDYEVEMGEVQKAVSSLAGFDTITKLSGSGSSGFLTRALIGNGDTSEIQDYANQVTGIMEKASDSVENMNFEPEINWEDVLTRLINGFNYVKGEAEFFSDGLKTVFSNFGDDDAIYKPLRDMTKEIEDILNAVGLDGTGFVKFWQGIGDDIYQMMTGGDSSILKGLKEIDDAFRYMLGDFGKGWSDFLQSAGSKLYELLHPETEKKGVSLTESLPESTVHHELFNGRHGGQGRSRIDAEALDGSDVMMWKGNLINPGQYFPTADVSSPATSRSTAYGQARFIPTNVPASQIHVHVDVDGREIAQTVTDYQQEDNLMSGGVYGG